MVEIREDGGSRRGGEPSSPPSVAADDDADDATDDGGAVEGGEDRGGALPKTPQLATSSVSNSNGCSASAAVGGGSSDPGPPPPAAAEKATERKTEEEEEEDDDVFVSARDCEEEDDQDESTEEVDGGGADSESAADEAEPPRRGDDAKDGDGRRRPEKRPTTATEASESVENFFVDAMAVEAALQSYAFGRCDDGKKKKRFPPITACDVRSLGPGYLKPLRESLEQEEQMSTKQTRSERAGEEETEEEKQEEEKEETERRVLRRTSTLEFVREKLRPSVYGAVTMGLNYACLIYFLAQLRKLAKAGKISNPQSVMQMPLRIYDILELIHTNKSLIKESVKGTSYETFMGSLDYIESHREEEVWKLGINETPNEDGVVFFGDESENELVYMVVTSNSKKSILVSFRGSITKADLWADLDLKKKRIKNPLRGQGVEKQAGHLKVHRGFYEYLHQDRDAGSSDVEEPSASLTVYQKILFQVKDLLQRHPDYEIWITGHSLGGALAALFAFEIAASDDPQIPKPVTCITIASPKVGNIHFRHAFEHLERSNLIRKFRVVNDGDVVPKLPSGGILSLHKALAQRDELYRHVGIELKLYNQSRCFRMSYNTRRGGPSSVLFDVFCLLRQTIFFFVCCPVGSMFALRCHSNFEYSTRLRMHFAALMKLFLDEIIDEIHSEGRRGTLHWGRAERK